MVGIVNYQDEERFKDSTNDKTHKFLARITHEEQIRYESRLNHERLANHYYNTHKSLWLEPVLRSREGDSLNRVLSGKHSDVLL